MKIEGFVYPKNFIKASTADEPGSVNFEEGQVLNARVLSCEKSIALLKTEAGHILRAKLDAGIILEQGSEVTLVATGHRDGIVLLKLVSEISDGLIVGKEGNINMDIIPKEFPESIVQILNKLEITVTKEVIEHIYSLVKQNSDLSPEKIIFMAANNMEPHEADSLFSADNKTAKLLGELIQLINSDVPAREQAGRSEKYDGAEPNSLSSADAKNQSLPEENINTGNLDNQTVRPSRTEQGLEPAAAAEREIPVYIRANDMEENGGVKASLPNTNADIVKNGPEITGYANQRENIAVSPDEATTGGENAAGALRPEASQSAKEGALSEAGIGLIEREEQKNKAFGQIQYDSRVDDEAQKVLMRLIAKMPAYRERSGYAKTPGKDLEQTAKTIINVLEKAQELKSSKTGTPDKLMKYLNNIFAKLTGESDDGTKLKKATDELYARLALLKEELPGMDLSGKAQLVEQTQKLLDYVKTFNEIDQYVYSQIPIILNGEYKTAELYLFKKRKGGRNINPENVKILLALDLKNLGRFEGLVSIKGKEVSLRIEVSKATAKTTFLQNTIKLHKMLAEIGFKLTNIIVKPIEKETSVENAMIKLMEFEESIKPALDLSI